MGTGWIPEFWKNGFRKRLLPDIGISRSMRLDSTASAAGSGGPEVIRSM